MRLFQEVTYPQGAQQAQQITFKLKIGYENMEGCVRKHKQ